MEDDVPRAGMKGVDFHVTSVIVSDAVAELKNINVTDSFVMPDLGLKKGVPSGNQMWQLNIHHL